MFNIMCITDLMTAVFSVPILVLILIYPCLHSSRTVDISHGRESVHDQCGAGDLVVFLLRKLVRVNTCAVEFAFAPSLIQSSFQYIALQGTIYDVITVICFFLAGCFCIYLAPKLDASLEVQATNDYPTASLQRPGPTMAPSIAVALPNATLVPPLTQSVVTTTHNADGSVTKVTSLTVVNPDGSRTVTETTQVEPATTLVVAASSPPTKIPEVTATLEP